MTTAGSLGRMRWLAPLAMLLCANLALAQEEEQREHSLSPYFFVEGGDPATDRLPLLGTEVTVDVAGVIADVTVRQTYKNDGTRPINARYVFPASTRAAVHGLTMTIDDQRVYAKIKEREEAKKAFVAAKKEGKNAALLEQQRPNVFTMDVANIVPGQRIDVELSYSELLVPTAGVYEFIYPTVVGPRYSTIPAAGATTKDTWIETPFTHEGKPPQSTLTLAGVLTAGMAVHELISPTHVIRAKWQAASRVEFSIDPAEGEAGNRDFVLRYRLDADQIQSGLMLYHGKEENFFLTMIQPPRRVKIDEVPPREYVFVLDVSGSMYGFPLDTAKALLRDLIGHLRPTDTFNVLLFSGDSQLMSETPVAATQEKIDQAIAVIDGQRGGGGTELLAAVKRAMTLPSDDEARSRSIIVITDGYIGAESEVFTFIRNNLGTANVFAFGIGSSVNRHLIEGIARAGMGEPFVALNAKEARESAARFREYVEYPLLTDVKVAFEGFDAYDVQPSSIPDVLAERPIVVFGKWRGEASGQVVVTGFTGSGKFEQSFAVSDVQPDESTRALRYLWARARVADLSDFNESGETDEVKKQLVSLGLTYSLLTRHTSFIAVHEAIRNPLALADDVMQPLPLPAGVSDSAVGGGTGGSVGSGDEPGLIWLVSLALAAGLGLVLRGRLLAGGR